MYETNLSTILIVIEFETEFERLEMTHIFKALKHIDDFRLHVFIVLKHIVIQMIDFRGQGKKIEIVVQWG